MSEKVIRGPDGFVTIEGTRIRVKDVISQYQSALDELVETVLQDYFPQLSKQQVQEALRYWRQNPEQIETEVNTESRQFRDIKA